MRNILLFFVMMGALIVSAHHPKPIEGPAPNPEKIKALNLYVDFINESTHGLLIVVKLLENFNLDINKYVDLASYQINQYSNSDLPFDLFDDKDHYFYERSPYELYDIANQAGQSLNRYNEMASIATNIKADLGKINNIRFELEKLIKNNDLSVKENLTKVYQKLEEAANLYDQFFISQKKLEAIIIEEGKKNESSPTELKPMFFAFDDLYASSRNMLLLMRNKQEDNGQFVQAQNRAYQLTKTLDIPNTPKTQSAKFKFNWNNLMTSNSDFNKLANEYNQQKVTNDQYAIYGPFYFSYNVSGLSKFNRYGIGIVNCMNTAIELSGAAKLKYTELPHYFKVIYPQKLEKVDFIAPKTSVISTIPTKVKDRFVATTDKKIRVTTDVVEFLFYDHMIQDGDVVSVNFNGEWIMEKEELELAPKKFKLRLNKEGRNYLMLHADNVGTRPPNTIGVSYNMGNTKKEITLSSDFEKSELIEIEIID